MHVDFAFLCDHAESSGPKLNALGIGIDTIFLADVPGRHTGFFFCASLAASAAEVGQKQLDIRLLGPDGQDVIPAFSGTIPIVAPPVPGKPSRSRLAVQFANIEFPSYGDYAVHLLMNGTEMTSVQFSVNPVPTTSSA